MTPEFKKYVTTSVGLHIAAFLMLVYWGEIFHLFPHKPSKITWVQIAKGTGEKPSDSSFKKAKGMPESTIREQKDALKEKAVDNKGKDQKSVEAPKKSKVQEYSEKRATPDGAIKFKSKEGTTDRTMEEALARINNQLEKRKVEIEAAQVEKEGTGQSPDGTLNATNTETDPELIAYYAAIRRKINQEWITTPKQLEEGQVLKTQVNVLIDSSGIIVSTSYETKSGDVSFDLSAQRAVERAAPFPPPPDKIKDEAISEGFLIEFNPKSVVGSF